MFHRAARICLEVVAALVLIAVAGAGLAGWRLAQGPVSLSALTPYIDDALESQLPGLDLTIGDTVVAWEGWTSGVGLRLRDVELRTQAGARVAAIPEGAVSLSFTALLRGRVVPTEAESEGLRLSLERQPDGSIRLRGQGDAAETSTAQGDMPNLFDWLRGGRDQPRLRRIVMRNAEIELADPALGAAVRLQRANLAIQIGDDGAGLSADFDVVRRDTRLRLAVAARAHTASRTLDATITFEDLRPALFADLHPATAPLAALDAPVGGRLEIHLDEALRPVGGRADLKLGAGKLTEPTLFAQPVAIASASAVVDYDRGRDTVAVEALELDLGGGTTARASAVIEKLSSAPRVTGRASARRVAVESFATLWPAGAARNARKWIVANLSAGQADEAEFEFALHADAPDWSGFDADQLNGDVRYSGITVNYLNPMPKVTGVAGRLNLTLERVEITPTTGAIGTLALQEGRIAITGLNEPDQVADIALTVKGPVREVMQLIDSRPLGYAKAVGLDPDSFAGESTTRLRLVFPLIDRLKMENLKVSGAVEATGFAQKRVALGQDASDGTLKASFDEKGLRTEGRLTFAGIPLDIDFTQAFLSSAPEQQRLRASGRVPAGGLAALGFDPAPFLEGPMPVTIDVVLRRGGRGDIAIEGGLDEAALAIAELGWTKPAGVPGSGRIELILQRDRLSELRIPRVIAGDLDAAARIIFAADGKTVSRIELTRLKAGRTDIGGTVVRERAGWRAQLNGRSLDASALLKETNTAAPDAQRPRIAIALRADELHTTADRSLTAVVFEGERTRRWTTLKLNAQGPTRDGVRAPFTVDLTTAADGNQRLEASSGNAGAMLRGLGITENVVGGDMKVSGATDPTRADRALLINGQIRDYRMVEVPAIARFLSIALLTGLADSMRGEGIGFRTFDVKAWLTETALEIEDMTASGPALGITSKGKLDFINDEVDLEGVIIPANTVNSLLGRIPLVGDVLFGPGLFAATYTAKGPQKDPKVSINALSAIAPGILRKLFSGGNAPSSAPPSGGDNFPGNRGG